MNKDEFQGGARYVGGKVEKAVGDTVNSRDWQVDGAPELADKIGSEARDAGERAAEVARRGAASAQASAQDAPVLWALGAAAVGYGIAWLVHGRRD